MEKDSFYVALDVDKELLLDTAARHADRNRLRRDDSLGADSFASRDDYEDAAERRRRRRAQMEIEREKQREADGFRDRESRSSSRPPVDDGIVSTIRDKVWTRKFLSVVT